MVFMLQRPRASLIELSAASGKIASIQTVTSVRPSTLRSFALAVETRMNARRAVERAVTQLTVAERISSRE
jgi:hypothetical protein